MKKNSMMNWKLLSMLALLLICTVLLSACGGDNYEKYATAYNKLWANGGIDANISADLTMDGQNKHYDGNFKVDNRSDILYYEMQTAEGKTIQFSDGSYLYTQQGDHKIKYSLAGAAENNAQAPEEPDNQEQPEFTVSDFLNEFAGMFEAGKIKELGLFDPIAKTVVMKTNKNGDEYTLEVADSVVKLFVNTLAVQQSGTNDTVQVTDMKNFKYTATVKNGVVTAQNYSGDVTVKVPASIVGEDKEYQVNMNIKTEFLNPGQAVNITLPSTEDYEEISGLMIPDADK